MTDTTQYRDTLRVLDEISVSGHTYVLVDAIDSSWWTELAKLAIANAKYGKHTDEDDDWDEYLEEVGEVPYELGLMLGYILNCTLYPENCGGRPMLYAVAQMDNEGRILVFDPRGASKLHCEDEIHVNDNGDTIQLTIHSEEIER